MKKYLLSLLAVVLGIGMAQARPVSLSQAKYVGQQFVQFFFYHLQLFISYGNHCIR